MSASDCPICCEQYNGTFRKKSQCVSCQFTCCRKCMEAYILSIKDFAQCMSCHRLFSRFEQTEIFTFTFLNSVYKKHHATILLEREKALMPEAQAYLEERKRKDELEAEISSLRDQIRKLKKRKDDLEIEVSNIKHSKKPAYKPRYVRKCTMNNCRGLVNEEWVCSVCQQKTCRNCFEVRAEEHKCDPQTLETAKLIRSDTKPCPSCGTLIHKISGCDQMFCTCCNSAFSWRSGQLERGVIHNPHYYEWMRKNNITIPRNPGDVPCGRALDLNHYNVRQFSDFFPIEKTRRIIHIREVDLRSFQQEVSTLNIRVQYLLGKMSEENFKIQLEKKDKEAIKRREISEVLRTFVECSTDILFRAHESRKFKEAKQYQVEKELSKLTQFINERLEIVSKKLKCVHYGIVDLYFKPIGK